MKTNLAYLSIATIIVIWWCSVYMDCFVPASVIDELVTALDKETRLEMGVTSDSESHDHILRRGVIRSVARYFHDQPGGKKKIKINKLDKYEDDIDKLYSDYYGRKPLVIELNVLLNIEMEPNVASVDFDTDTKDLPYAHFDAEKFPESNQRVIDFRAKIDVALRKSDYSTARKLSSQILHTIHDFYSHSNWVEMGKTSILSTIGTKSFSSQPFVQPKEANICNNKCKLITTKCSKPLTAISNVLKQLNPDITLVCPLQYYKCDKNIVILNKLVSGFYTGQELPDGTVVENPGNLMKCNHGGVLDSNSYKKQALGGINKDSGIYLISPHANLHLKAADLAVLHTEHFFNSIRTQIGDKAFADFLKIENII